MRDIRDMEAEAARVASLTPEQRANYDAELAEHRRGLGLDDDQAPAAPDPATTVQVNPRYLLAREVIRCVHLRDKLKRTMDAGGAADLRPRLGRILVDIEAGAMALAANEPGRLAPAIDRLKRWS